MQEPLDDKEKCKKLYELERDGEINSSMDEENEHRIFYKGSTPLTDDVLDDLWQERIWDKRLNEMMKQKYIAYIQ